jgi:predicted GIY-YIG superfamily endonuclease
MNTIPLTLNIIRPLDLKVVDLKPVSNDNALDICTEMFPSDHVCYILKSLNTNRIYIGYTINFPRRIRQHNGEIAGGAKKTSKWRPWVPICIIQGFYEKSSALRFEYRLQHPSKKKKAGENSVTFVLETLNYVINNGDGSIANRNKMPWPSLNIKWYIPFHAIHHLKVVNKYIETK